MVLSTEVITIPVITHPFAYLNIHNIIVWRATSWVSWPAAKLVAVDILFSSLLSNDSYHSTGLYPLLAVYQYPFTSMQYPAKTVGLLTLGICLLNSSHNHFSFTWVNNVVYPTLKVSKNHNNSVIAPLFKSHHFIKWILKQFNQFCPLKFICLVFSHVLPLNRSKILNCLDCPCLPLLR